jgi:probable HAF family extracellular repeat protein
VVGYSSGPGGTRAFLWTASGGLKDLGTLPGGNYSRAFGINNLGAVVGTSRSSAGTRAFLWTSIAGMRDLNGLTPALELGLVLSEGHCISDLGQIVALSGGGDQDPSAGGDNHEREHFYRAFLLVP